MSERPFPDDELLREALEEVAAAGVGEFVEEPWGSTAVAAAEQIAREGASDELVELAREALERVAANSQLANVVEDPVALDALLDDLRRRLG